MKLEDYLRLNNETQDSFAARVGTSQGTISRLLPQDGRPPLRKPSIDLAARIARETAGLVTANDFIDAAPVESGSGRDPAPGAGAEDHAEPAGDAGAEGREWQAASSRRSPDGEIAVTSTGKVQY